MTFTTIAPSGRNASASDADTMAAIKRAVAKLGNVTIRDMESSRRDSASWRQLAMYLCRHATKASYPAIGRAFGDKDHSTVMHACRVCAPAYPGPGEVMKTLGITVS